MKSCHKIEKKTFRKQFFFLFTEQKMLLMKNENEASVPDFSSWTLQDQIKVGLTFVDGTGSGDSATW